MHNRLAGTDKGSQVRNNNKGNTGKRLHVEGSRGSGEGEREKGTKEVDLHVEGCKES